MMPLCTDSASQSVGMFFHSQWWAVVYRVASPLPRRENAQLVLSQVRVSHYSEQFHLTFEFCVCICVLLISKDATQIPIII